MSLQVIGPAAKGSKVVLWSESRLPRQTWQIDSFGRICSQMFENKVLDVKGKALAFVVVVLFCCDSDLGS